MFSSLLAVLLVLAGVLLLASAFGLVCLSVVLTVNGYIRSSENNRKDYFVFSPLDTLRLIKEIYSKGGD